MFIIPLEFWIVFAAACLLLELVTAGFYLMSVGIGSIAAAITNYLGFDPTMQLVAFAIITVICLIASRPLAHKLTKGGPNVKVAAERLIGKEGVVTEPIDPENAGMIKISGEDWRAVANDDILVGEKVIVEEVKGVKLEVRKK